jgi:hypothetical protein
LKRDRTTTVARVERSETRGRRGHCRDHPGFASLNTGLRTAVRRAEAGRFARSWPVWALALPLLFVAACDLGRSNPLASFESRCASLPSARFDIVQVPVTYTQDRVHSIAELTVLGGNSPATHNTFGLTTARFGHQTDIELKVVDDAAGGRTCGTANVRIELSMQPMTVYIAREIERTPCPRDATFAHELRHVAVFRAVLDEAARDLRADLAEAMGTGLRRAASARELERAFNAQLQAYLSVFMSQWQREMGTRQEAVDSPEETERTATACVK